MKKKDIIVYFDMDDVMANFSKSRKEHLEKEPGIQWPQCQYGFFEELEPVDGAIEAFLEVDKVAQAYLLSRPSELNPRSYIEKCLWVKKHLGQEYVNKLILSCHKQLSIGDYLIDDYADHWEKFLGEKIHFKTDKFPDHKTVLEYLIPKIEKSEVSIYETFRNVLR